MAKQTFTTGQVLTAAQMTSLQQTAMGGGSTIAKTASYVLVAADAGTVVQMNAAGATTITVNTALFAAGDTVQIQNIGAGVCTVTAGTATVTTAGSLALSQWEGGQLYFSSASASIFFDIVQGSGMTNPLTTTGDTIYSSSGTNPARLGIGSTGQVLTVAAGVPSWATPSGGGSSWTEITSQAVSGNSTYTVSSLTSYNQLMVVAFSINDGLNIRFNSDTTNNYLYACTNPSLNTIGYPGANVIGDQVSSAGDSKFICGEKTTSGFLLLQGCKSTDKKIGHSVFGVSGSNGYPLFGANIYKGTSAISSVTFSSSTGNNYSSGTVRVYGSTI